MSANGYCFFSKSIFLYHINSDQSFVMSLVISKTFFLSLNNNIFTLRLYLIHTILFLVYIYFPLSISFCKNIEHSCNFFYLLLTSIQYYSDKKTFRYCIVYKYCSLIFPCCPADGCQTNPMIRSVFFCCP